MVILKKNTNKSFFSALTAFILFFSALMPAGLLFAQAPSKTEYPGFFECLEYEDHYTCCLEGKVPAGDENCITQPGSENDSAGSSKDSQKTTTSEEGGKAVRTETGKSGAGAGGLCNPGFESLNGICVPVSEAKGFAGANDLIELIEIVVKFLLFLAGVVAVLFIVLGGFWYMTSGGNEEQSEKGKKFLINAIIGLVIIMLSYAIVNIVVEFLTSEKLSK